MLTAECHNCGRKIEVTEQEARHLNGTLVCPQCLSTVKVDVSLLPPPPLDTHEEVKPKQRCRFCGKLIEGEAQFCQHCGKPTEAAPVASRQVSPPPHPATTTTSPPPYTKRPGAAPANRVSPSTRTNPKYNSPRMSNISNTRKISRKKEKEKKPLSPLGCLGISVLIVIVFFLIYFLAGNY